MASDQLEGFDISLQNIFHRYGEPPAEILARFDTGESIHTYIGPEGDSHTVLFDRGGRVVSSKGEARQLNLPRVSVLPQVAPLAKTEEILVGDYVRRNLSSSLAPAHFRNRSTCCMLNTLLTLGASSRTAGAACASSVWMAVESYLEKNCPL